MSETEVVARSTEAVSAARRSIEICNACRYCETFCAVFLKHLTLIFAEFLAVKEPVIRDLRERTFLIPSLTFKAESKSSRISSCFDPFSIVPTATLRRE